MQDHHVLPQENLLLLKHMLCGTSDILQHEELVNHRRNDERLRIPHLFVAAWKVFASHLIVELLVHGSQLQLGAG